MFTLEIATTCDAFVAGAGREVARILRELADKSGRSQHWC